MTTPMGPKPPKPPTAPKAPKQSNLTSDQMRGYLTKAGFSGVGLDQAMTVAQHESGYRPTAHNPNAATGDNSYGLFQINMIGKMGPARMKQYGLKSYNDLYNPATNASVAYKMSHGGTNWNGWTGAAGPKGYLANSISPSRYSPSAIFNNPNPVANSPLGNSTAGAGNKATSHTNSVPTSPKRTDNFVPPITFGAM